MCLYISGSARAKRKPRAKVAKEDMIVYKVFSQISQTYYDYNKCGYVTKDIFCTPYQNMEVPKKMSFVMCESNFGLRKRASWDNAGWEVHEGIHAYQDSRCVHVSTNTNYEIRKCIIPKGTKYYIGRYDIVTELLIVLSNKDAKCLTY